MKKEEMTYEQSIQKLTSIVQKIELGEMDIDSLSINLKEAKELITFCKTKLTKVEEEVKKVLED